jgi:hypothetical protein
MRKTSLSLFISLETDRSTPPDRDQHRWEEGRGEAVMGRKAAAAGLAATGKQAAAVAGGDRKEGRGGEASGDEEESRDGGRR